jgi:hypothetical protein
MRKAGGARPRTALKIGAQLFLAASSLALATAAQAQDAADPAAAQADDGNGDGEEIVVTGFRQSLGGDQR